VISAANVLAADHGYIRDRRLRIGMDECSVVAILGKPEATVREFAHVYRDAVKVEGSLEVRKTGGSTSDWQRSPPKS